MYYPSTGAMPRLRYIIKVACLIIRIRGKKDWYSSKRLFLNNEETN